mgnify:CR=1 FL=1
MTTQLVPAKEKVSNVRGLLEKAKSQIAMALPKHMTSDRMLRVAMTEVQKTPLLLDCEPITLVAAVIQASQLGLELGVLGQAYLVPFRNKQRNRMEVQLIPGYRGLVSLARRSGDIVTFEARVVHANDAFEYSYGLEGKLNHKPDMSGNPGAVIAAYAVAKFKDGGYQYEVMSVRELDAIRKGSKAADSGPWVTHTEEMYRKTVARRLCKWLPASVELASAVELDGKAEAGLPQDLDVITIEAEAVVEGEGNGQGSAPATRLEAATAALKGCDHAAIKARVATLQPGRSVVCPTCGEDVKPQGPPPAEREAGEEG